MVYNEIEKCMINKIVEILQMETWRPPVWQTWRQPTKTHFGWPKKVGRSCNGGDDEHHHCHTHDYWYWIMTMTMMSILDNISNQKRKQNVIAHSPCLMSLLLLLPWFKPVSGICRSNMLFILSGWLAGYAVAQWYFVFSIYFFFFFFLVKVFLCLSLKVSTAL